MGGREGWRVGGRGAGGGVGRVREGKDTVTEEVTARQKMYKNLFRIALPVWGQKHLKLEWWLGFCTVHLYGRP